MRAEAFRVIEPNGHEYRIYADGRVEGFTGSVVICNKIPALLRQAAYRHCSCWGRLKVWLLRMVRRA